MRTRFITKNSAVSGSVGSRSSSLALGTDLGPMPVSARTAYAAPKPPSPSLRTSWYPPIRSGCCVICGVSNTRGPALSPFLPPNSGVGTGVAANSRRRAAPDKVAAGELAIGGEPPPPPLDWQPELIENAAIAAIVPPSAANSAWEGHAPLGSEAPQRPSSAPPAALFSIPYSDPRRMSGSQAPASHRSSPPLPILHAAPAVRFQVRKALLQRRPAHTPLSQTKWSLPHSRPSTRSSSVMAEESPI